MVFTRSRHSLGLRRPRPGQTELSDEQIDKQGELKQVTLGRCGVACSNWGNPDPVSNCLAQKLGRRVLVSGYMTWSDSEPSGPTALDELQHAFAFAAPETSITRSFVARYVSSTAKSGPILNTFPMARSTRPTYSLPEPTLKTAEAQKTQTDTFEQMLLCFQISCRDETTSGPPLPCAAPFLVCQ